MPATSRPLKTALKVVVWRDGRALSSRHFDRPEVTLGRSPTSDIVLDDDLVSWNHARVVLGQSGIRFVDDSSNGSFRNGQRITEVRLGRGGVVEVPPFEIDVSMDLVPDDRESSVSPVAEAPAVAGPKTPPAISERTVVVPPASLAELRILEAPGDLQGKVFPLSNRAITIGRGTDCDIRFDLGSVSRRHAKLTPAADGRWLLQDSGSRNGVEVNGQLVQEMEIESGDRITFGIEIVAILQTLRPDPPPPVAPAARESGPSTVGDALLVTVAPSALDARIATVKIAGRVDAYTYPYLRDELAKAMAAGSRYLVADLSECRYCDHAGLGVLVNAQTTLGQKKGALRLVGLSRQLLDAFKLLRLDQVLVVSPSEKAAVADLARLIK